MTKMLNAKNIFNSILILLFLALVFVPSAKALVLEGLMKIGFFSPDTNAVKVQMDKRDLSGIRFKDVKGKTVDLGELRGRVVFLNFWATWCPPCLAEMPAVNRLYEKFRNDEGVVFILVDADGDLKKSQGFMDRKKYGLPVYMVDSEIPDQLFQGSLPTTVVFDKQGRISYHESGAENYSDRKFIAFINRLKTMN
jgi:thiol-disulfide isomerase/thioredoxin